MPLDTVDSDAPPVTDSDPFSGDTDAYNSPSSGNYPRVSRLAPLSGILGYSEANRDLFVRSSLFRTAQLLDLKLTPVEREGLSYYNGRFYTYESYGDVLGISTGMLIAFLLRNRKPGTVSSMIVRLFTKKGPQRDKAAKWLSRGLKFSVWGSIGRMYGLTSAGFQALQKNKLEKRADPNLRRVTAATEKKREATAHEIATHGPDTQGVKDLASGKGEEENDGQSLGGLDIIDEAESKVGASEEGRFAHGRPSDQVAELEASKRGGGHSSWDDPFGVGDGDDASPTRDEGVAVQTKWTNTHSNTGESTWDRIRKGQAPTSSPPANADQGDANTTTGSSEPKVGGWPTRAPLKGYGQDVNKEPRTDSFTFSKSEEERQLARQEAQREFDARVEKERSGAVGDGYAEGDSGNRKRWGK